jgi:flagellar biosynthetic protein FlhB
MAWLAACGFGLLASLVDAWRQAWASLQPLPAAQMAQVAHVLSMRIAGELASPLAVLVLAALVAGYLQAGPVISQEAVKPDIGRLHPKRVLQRLFSIRTALESLRALARLAAIAAVAWWVIERLQKDMPTLVRQPPIEQARLLLDAIAELGLRIAAVMAVFALWDLLRSRREFAQEMRMSRREVRDEHKQREGDPRIRSRLRDLRRKLLKRTAALRNTRHADVVVTNPTHLAIALRYEEGRMAAPMLVAKGAGNLAAAMRQIAGRHGVAVVQNPALARRLFRHVEIEQELPPVFHAEVAAIFAWLIAIRREARATREQAA